MAAEDLFTPNWIIFGLGEIRPTKGTYSATDYSSLPPVEISENFQWLVPMHPEVEEEMEDHRKGEESEKAYLVRRASLLREAEEKGVRLPSAFIKLTGDVGLRNRIPSCTACYFGLPDGIMESPFREGDFIIRFLNDQQCCICWYLYIPHDAEAFVISSNGNEEEVFLDTIVWRDNSTVDNVQSCCWIVGKSFEEFVYRFWIENSIWFQMEFDLEMGECERDYIKHIAPDYFD